MDRAYMIPLGFNFIKWLGDHLLKPIIDAVVQILDPIFSAFLDFLGGMIMKMLAGVFYGIYTSLLSMVNFSQTIFDYLSGAKKIYADYGGFALTDYLLDFFVNYGPVERAFIGVFVVSLSLCTIFTFIACVQAAANYADTGRKVRDVLHDLWKALLTYILVQALVIAVVGLTNNLLTVVDKTIQLASVDNPSDLKGGIRLANVIFVSTTLDAAKEPEAGRTDPLKADPWEAYYNGDKNYTDDDALKSDFEATKVDYVTGYLCCIFMIFVMFSAIFLFIQRLFEVVLLYVISPFFVASMPLDGGSRFSAWREMFIAKCLSSYGIVVIMRLFIIFLPIFMGDITYSTDHTVNALIRLLLVLGSCIAVKKGSGVLLQVIHPQAAQSAESAMGSLTAIAMTARSVASAGGHAFRGKK
ncbi:MAG: hypothetical protein LUG90_01750 [Clostridiaceae bacterium]|nr:hypothetical protein [Clostridiaceae bacterium]